MQAKRRQRKPAQSSTVTLKRAYEAPGTSDGYRVLVDRLWPRGVTKRAARIDLWLKGIAPSTALRKWFGHDPAKWETFSARYRAELDKNPQAVDELVRLARPHRITLVYGARDAEHNHAIVLKTYLDKLMSERS